MYNVYIYYIKRSDRPAGEEEKDEREKKKKQSVTFPLCEKKKNL